MIAVERTRIVAQTLPIVKNKLFLSLLFSKCYKTLIDKTLPIQMAILAMLLALCGIVGV